MSVFPEEQERLGDQVVGDVGTDPPGQVAVQRAGVLVVQLRQGW